MKIRPVGTELLHVERRTDRHNEAKLMFSFRDSDTGQVYLRILRFTPSVSIHQCSILTYHQSQRALATDSVVKKQTQEIGPTH
jgi:hypothetical protein